MEHESGALFGKPFAEDADYVVINGMYIKGRETMASAHQRIFDTIYKDTNIKLTVKQIPFLRADVAVVHITAQRQGATKELTQDAIHHPHRDERKWRLGHSAFQNTGITPPR